MPAALKPNVKFAPIAACTAWTPPDQHVPHEVLGRNPRERVREREHHEHVEPARLDQRALRSTVVSSRGSLPGRQHLPRVPVERHRRPTACLVRGPASPWCRTPIGGPGAPRRRSPRSPPTARRTAAGPRVPCTICMRESVPNASAAPGAVRCAGMRIRDRGARSRRDRARRGAPATGGRARATTAVGRRCDHHRLVRFRRERGDRRDLRRSAASRRASRCATIRRVGTREVVLPALERGLIEVVPEYAGSALDVPGWARDRRSGGHARSPAAPLGPRGLDAARAGSAQSRNGLVVTSETADRPRLRTISDLRAPPRRARRSAGLPSARSATSVCPASSRSTAWTFESFLPLDAGGPITADAVQRGTVDVGVLFTTDGSLAEHDLVLLEDDRRLQPAENVTPLVRRDAVERFGDRDGRGARCRLGGSSPPTTCAT